MQNTTILWRVEYTALPKIGRHCPRCGDAVYACSTDFRINANKSLLDVWLIYRCEGCDNTYNLPLYERVSPTVLQKSGEYAALLANDTTLAARYARDTALLKKHRLAALYDEGAFVVHGALPVAGGGTVQVQNLSGAPLRLDRLLSIKLGLSRSAVKKLFDTGLVQVPGVKKPHAAPAQTGLCFTLTGGFAGATPCAKKGVAACRRAWGA